MSGLADFIAARLDEDEAAANAALEQSAEEETRWWFDDATPETPREFHVARHDPARVLREVTAKRALLAACTDDMEAMAKAEADGDYGNEYTEGFIKSANACALWALRAMAAAWSDHPDYRAEWGTPS